MTNCPGHSDGKHIYDELGYCYGEGCDERKAPVAVIPHCRCCGTTEDLHRDVGSGGPWRCGSSDCMVF